MANPTISRALEAESNGELWRAKNILQGRLSSHPFDPELYETYGAVLLRMGDELEAGRYLFISGARKPAYEKAINLFLDRFANSSPRQIHSSLPSRARVVPISKLPTVVIGELKERGFVQRQLEKEFVQRARPDASNGSVLAVVVGISMLLILIAGFANGIHTIAGWLR